LYALGRVAGIQPQPLAPLLATGPYSFYTFHADAMWFTIGVVGLITRTSGTVLSHLLLRSCDPAELSFSILFLSGLGPCYVYLLWPHVFLFALNSGTLQQGLVNPDRAMCQHAGGQQTGAEISRYILEGTHPITHAGFLVGSILVVFIICHEGAASG